MRPDADAGFSSSVSTLRARRDTHRVILAVAAAVLTAILATLSAPAGAQTTTTTAAADKAGSAQVSLVSQTNWVSGSSPFDLTLAVQTQEAPQNLDLVVTVFSATRSRSAFTQTLDNTVGGSAIILDRRPLAEVLGPDGLVRLSYAVGDTSQRSTYIRNSGVYPVRVELRETGVGDSVDSFVTHLVKAPTGDVNPLGVSVVLPVSIQSGTIDDPFATPNGGAALSTVSSAIQANSSVPVAVAPSPESVSRLTQNADGEPQTSTVIESLASSMASKELLPSTWAPIPASLYGGPAAELDAQFDLGRSTIQTSVGAPSSVTWPANQLMSPQGLEYLQKRGFQNIIVRESNLSESSQTTTLAKPFQLRIDNESSITALQADDQLSRYFTSDDPVLAAYNLLADLEQIYGDYPAQDRAVVIMPPADWQPNAAFLQVLLSGLAASPTLTAVSTDDAFAVSPQMGANRTTAAMRSLGNLDDDQNSSLNTGALENYRRQINGFSSMVTSDNATLRRLDQRLLLTESSRLSNDDRRQSLANFEDEFERQVGAIRLPDERSIRLTARTGEIPVSIQNDSGYPVNVKIRVSSDQLTFLDGQERTIQIPRQQSTERFSIEARTSGAFPVQVQMTSPDGSLVLYDSRITVRSTATSAVGVVLTAGSLAFLVLWWIHSIYRNRKNKTKPA